MRHDSNSPERTGNLRDSQSFAVCYVARNRGNELYLHLSRPHWSEHYQNWISADPCLPLIETMFPDLTYEDEPVPVSVCQTAQGKLAILPLESLN